VIRQDGAAFGGSTDLRELGFEINLPEPLDERTRWSAAGIKRFVKGDRPDPADVFKRVAAVLDRFIDFRKSLANQATMCEFVACFILSTWFLEAFNVAGYLWINGERGSGKTNLLILLSELSYLGCFISPSASFASLRDMANYGGTLCIDDAESIADPRKTQPEKRDLLLGGNRRGMIVALKEATPDGKWITKHVHVYSARAFSAIGTPDPTLGSRCTIVPLIRTARPEKANSDPYDYDKWPHERRALVDDLWALALASQAEMIQLDKWIGENAKLSGRPLQPWRAILAISRWLETRGVAGIFGRMEALSLAYQNERPELETPDTTRILLEALCEHAVGAISAKRATKHFKVAVSELKETSQRLIREGDIGLDSDSMDARRIGRLLSRLRFKEIPRRGGKGSRQRDIPLLDLVDLCDGYKVKVPAQVRSTVASVELPAPTSDPEDANSADGTNGIDGTDGTHHAEACLPIQVVYDAPVEECPTTACNWCGEVARWRRGDGVLVCSRCHPQPPAASAQS
jgi:hypothetical protein